jgi:formate hydrogenlyase subunit 3/multisubunit Na+/H+ antiporter MnhD subunit
MARKKKMTHIMAILALFWIIIWIIWTWVLVFFSGNNTTEQSLTPEQYLELQDLINAESWAIIEDNTGSETLTWEIN